MASPIATKDLESDSEYGQKEQEMDPAPAVPLTKKESETQEHVNLNTKNEDVEIADKSSTNFNRTLSLLDERRCKACHKLMINVSNSKQQW